MKNLLIIVLGLVLLGALGYVCIYFLNHNIAIQQDIETRTHAALDSQELLDQVVISTSGRDIILSGVVAGEEIKQQAEQHAKNVYGVRKVDNQLTTVTTAEPNNEIEPEPTPEPEEELKVEPMQVPNAASPAPKPVQEPIPEPTPELPSAVKPTAVENVIEQPEVESLPEYTCQQDFNDLLDGNKIRFATSSAEIDISSHSLLSDLSAIATQCPDANIEISGHTDSRGSDELNQRLSQERATSVMNYLVSIGIDATRLSAIGYGESYPIADNDTAEGLAKNRRIEFNVEGL